MAILNHDDLINSISEESVQPKEIVGMTEPSMPAPSEGEKIGAAFSRFNTIGSWVANGATDEQITDPSFDRFSQIKGTEWEPFMSKFIYADNQDEIDQTKQRIEKEMEMARITSNSGWSGYVYNFAAGLVDPTLAVPIVGQASKIKTLAGIGKFGLETAASTAGAVALQEAALHKTQMMRTKEESAYNIAAGAVLGGILGTAIGGVMAGKYKAAHSTIKEILRTGDVPPMPKGSLSAAEFTPSDASISNIPNWVAKAATVPGLRAPIIEGLTSSSPFLKDVTSRLFENNLIKERNRVGIKTDKQILAELEKQGYKNVDRLEENKAILKDGSYIPITRERPSIAEPVNMETRLKQDMSDSLQYKKNMEEVYMNYVGTKDAGILKGERAYIAARGQKKMTAKEFYEEVGKYSRRAEKSGNEFIDRGVEVYRKMLSKQNEKMKSLAAEGNAFEQFLGELELKGRQSYFTIVPDRNRIIQNRGTLEKNIADYYTSTKGMDPVEARSMASEHLDHFIGLDNAGTINDLAQKFVTIDKGARFTKERAWDVPDTILEEGLVNDAMQIGSQYLEMSNKMVRFQEFLNDIGEKNIAGVKGRLKSEYDSHVARLPIDHPEYSNLKAKAETDLVNNAKLMDDFFAIALGQFNKRSPADRALRFLRTYNYIRLMGNIALSSITDLAMPIFKHGLGRTIMDGYVAGIRGFLSGSRKLVNKDLSDIYAALDLEMNNTLRTIMDPDFASQVSTRSAQIGVGPSAKLNKLANDIGYTTAATTNYLSEKFGALSGIDYWNAINKRMGARIAESRIIRDLKNYDSITASEKEYLNSLGIGSGDVKSLLNQIDTKASEYNGAWITNIVEWTDKQAAGKFRDAIIKEVDSTIVTPSRGDIPRLQQQSEIARVLLQFKGFFSAMTTKVLISGIQRHDANVLQGVVGLLALGAAQYNIRMLMQGKTPDNSPDNLLLESINRSGLLGLVGDPMFGLVLRPLTTGSRYMNQSVVEYPLGPSASLIKDLSRVYSDTMNMDFDENTLKSMGHLTPYQNLFWLRLLLDKLNGKEGNTK